MVIIVLPVVPCRHSGKFYNVLSTNVISSSETAATNTRKQYTPSQKHSVTLLTVLAECCGSSDPSIRKFASFAGKHLDDFILDGIFYVSNVISGQCCVPFE